MLNNNNGTKQVGDEAGRQSEFSLGMPSSSRGGSGTIRRAGWPVAIGLLLVVLATSLIRMPLRDCQPPPSIERAVETPEKEIPIATTSTKPQESLSPTNAPTAPKTTESNEGDGGSSGKRRTGWEPSRACTVKERDFQGSNMYLARVQGGCSPSADTWLKIVQTVMPRARTFVDIGSNKGYTVARFYELWNPELGLRSKSLRDALVATGTKDKQVLDCGACRDCTDPPQYPLVESPGAMLCSGSSKMRSVSHRHRQGAIGACSDHLRDRYELIRVFAFDGNEVMVSFAKQARDIFISNRIAAVQQELSKNQSAPGADWPDERAWPPVSVIQDLSQKWTLETKAFVEKYVAGETVSFFSGQGELGKIAAEGGGGGVANSNGTVTVSTLSIDALVEREGLSRIDLIKMDTEGFDPKVIRGARNLLKRSGVIVVIFEYHIFWGNETLQAILKSEFEGYACYVEGTTAMLKLTHECWSSSLEFRAWSNVWCVAERTPEGLILARIFDSHSVAFF